MPSTKRLLNIMFKSRDPYASILTFLFCFSFKEMVFLFLKFISVPKRPLLLHLLMSHLSPTTFSFRPSYQSRFKLSCFKINKSFYCLLSFFPIKYISLNE